VKQCHKGFIYAKPSTSSESADRNVIRNCSHVARANEYLKHLLNNSFGLTDNSQHPTKYMQCYADDSNPNKNVWNSADYANNCIVYNLGDVAAPIVRRTPPRDQITYSDHAEVF